MPGSECEATLASPCPVRSGIDVRGGCHLNFFGPWILTGQRFQLSLGRSGLETSKKIKHNPRMQMQHANASGMGSFRKPT